MCLMNDKLVYLNFQTTNIHTFRNQHITITKLLAHLINLSVIEGHKGLLKFYFTFAHPWRNLSDCNHFKKC